MSDPEKRTANVAWNSSDCFESFSPLNWGSNNDSKWSDEIQANYKCGSIKKHVKRDFK